MLHVRCTFGSDVKRLEVFIAWDDHLGSARPIVLTRFDKQEVESHPWYTSASGTETFAPRGMLPPVYIIKKLKLAHRFVARVIKHDDTTITATWDVTGFAAAVKSIEARCA